MYLLVLDISRSPILHSIGYPKCYIQSKPLVDQFQFHLKDAFKQEIDKMLKEGVLKPAHEATPWINSFILVEGKDKLRNLKVRICLDPTNLSKVIVWEPYNFKTPEDIAHLIAEAYIMICS